MLDVLALIGEGRFEDGYRVLDGLDNRVAVQKGCPAADDERGLADFFVMARYLDLLRSYGELWAAIQRGEFSASWGYLQDALDLLRIIKRFSTLDVEFFENQLLELEQAYPYKLFASAGMTVSWFKCSVCDLDIDSDDCPHRRGDLYMGEMVRAIAQEITEFDHMSLVTDPEDKRCVVLYEDTAPQFRRVAYIADLIRSRHAELPISTALNSARVGS